MPNRDPGTNQGEPKQPVGTPLNDEDQTNPRGTRRKNQAEPDSDQGQDRVEIGDPVPEDNRTIRANDETGEDEDLPTDDTNIEPGPRH